MHWTVLWTVRFTGCRYHNVQLLPHWSRLRDVILELRPLRPLLTRPLSREPGVESVLYRRERTRFVPHFVSFVYKLDWIWSPVSVAHRPGTITNTADRVFFLSSSSAASSEVRGPTRISRKIYCRPHRLCRRRCSGQENTFDIHCGLYCGARPPSYRPPVLRPRDVLAGAHARTLGQNSPAASPLSPRKGHDTDTQRPTDRGRRGEGGRARSPLLSSPFLRFSHVE